MSTQPQVELQVSQGDQTWGRIVLELDAERAPKSVANFLRYVDKGFYDGLIFHRVISGFMIQGGGYESPSRIRRDGLEPPVENEAANGLKNLRGTIAMARTSDPHSATSQFFLNVVDNAFLDHPGSDGWGYCVFGRVIEGLEVVDRIRNVETVANPGMGEKSQPKQPPVIRSARRVPSGG